MHPKQLKSSLGSVPSHDSLDRLDLLSLMGLKRRAKGMQNSTTAPIIIKVNDQPKLSSSTCMMGAKIKVPNPAPQLAMPLAKALFLSK